MLFWVHLVGIKGTIWWLFLEVNGGRWWRGKMAVSAKFVLGAQNTETNVWKMEYDEFFII